ALRGKACAAADSGDGQGRQREAHVESIGVQFEDGNAARRVDYVGDILPRRDEDGSETVRVLRVVTDGVGLQVADHGRAPDVEKLLRGAVQVHLQHVMRQQRARRNALAL